MPFIRCRWYEGDGTPISGGCKRQGFSCDFVHPSEPDWAKAPPPRVSWQSGGRGKAGERRGDSAVDEDRGWGRGRGRGRGRDTYGGDGHRNYGDMSGGSGDLARMTFGNSDILPPRPISTNWSGGAWGPSADPVPLSSKEKGKAKAKNTGGSFGGWISSTSDAPSTSALAPAPAMDTNGWGISLADKSRSGAADVPSGASPDAQGWGNASPVGWGSGAAEPGWSTAFGGESWGSGATEPGWGTALGGGESWGTAPGPGALEPTAEAGDNAMDVDRSAPQSQPPQLGTIPPPPPAADDLTSVRQEYLRVADAERGDGEDESTVGQEDILTSEDEDVDMNPDSLAGKKQATRRYVRIIRRAVHAQIKLSDAQIDLNRWTKASKSTTYEHIGRAARSVLAATTIKYDEEVGRRQEQLNAALARLGELPDSMYSYVKDFKPEQKQKDAEKFLDEVKQWVEGLKPLVEVAEQKEKEAQAKRDAYVFDDPPMPPRLAPIFAQIKGLAAAMNDREATHDYHAFMSIERDLISERIHSRIGDIAAAHARALLAAEEEVFTEPLDEAIKRATNVSSELDDQALSIADLYKDQDVITKRHKEVEECHGELGPRLIQLETRSVEAERTNTENQQALQKIRAQFVAYQARLPQPPISIATADQILEQLQPNIDQQVDDILHPAFKALQTTLLERLGEHQASLYTALHQEVLPLIDMISPAIKWTNEMQEAERVVREAEGM